MLSGFQSREFGLGLRTLLSEDVLSAVNGFRKGTKYKSEDSAMLVYNTVYKDDIKDDPLLRYFRAGMNKDGYWNSNHMKVQLEDSVDVLTYLFPTFDFVFLFDQSSGHTKLRSDGLHVGSMNMSYGGATTSMHDTIVNEVGPYKSTLNIGHKQVMNFTNTDEGPFWLTSEKKLASKYNRFVEGTTTIKKQRLMSPIGSLHIIIARDYHWSQPITRSSPSFQFLKIRGLVTNTHLILCQGCLLWRAIAVVHCSIRYVECCGFSYIVSSHEIQMFMSA